MLDISKVIVKLLELSIEKKKTLDVVYLITTEQTKAIEISDINRLNDLIDKKQIEIDKIKSLDEKFEQITDDLKLVYEVDKISDIPITNPRIKDMQNVISSIIDTVRKIQELEQENKNKLSTQKDDLEAKMSALKFGKKAVSNYGYLKNYQNPVYFDKNN